MLLLDVFDDVMVVVIVIFGMLLWVVLIECVWFVVGEMVFVNGVMGMLGWFVVWIVKYFGVVKVIVMGCNVVVL